MSIFCHKCGTQAKDGESVFCNKCGTKFIQESPEKKDTVCPSCGTKILDKESAFCDKCGSQTSIPPLFGTKPEVMRPVIKKKSPFLAVLLSFFITGAGQCYTNQWMKGIALFVISILSLGLLWGGIIIGIFPLIAIPLYSMYDAYRAAKRINGDGDFRS